MCLAISRKTKEASVAGIESVRRTVRKNKLSKGAGGQIIFFSGLLGAQKDFELTLLWWESIDRCEQNGMIKCM